MSSALNPKPQNLHQGNCQLVKDTIENAGWTLNPEPLNFEPSTLNPNF